jgi:hypothetical protein
VTALATRPGTTETPWFRAICWQASSTICQMLVTYGTKGSVRPEFYKTGTSIEVKNYNIESPAGRAALERNVVTQALQRKADLPTGTTQKLTIDARGQNVSLSEVKKILTNIETKSAGAIPQSNINVLW